MAPLGQQVRGQTTAAGLRMYFLFTKIIFQEKSSLHGLGITAIVCIDYNEEQFACECINLPDKRPPTHLLQLCKLIKEQKSGWFLTLRNLTLTLPLKWAIVLGE